MPPKFFQAGNLDRLKLGSGLILLLLGIWFLAPQPVYANAWIGSASAVYWLNLPLNQALLNFGTTLLAVVGIEAWILKHYQQIPLARALGISLLVNLFSTLIGLVNALLLIGAYLGALMFRMMFRRILKLTDYSEKMQRIRFVRDFRMPPFLFFLIINILSFIVGFVLDEMSIRDNQGLIMNSTPLLFSLLLAGSLAAFGFGLSLISEGYLLTYLLPDRVSNLTKTVVGMQLGSYGLIVLPLTLLQALIYAGYLPRLGQ